MELSDVGRERYLGDGLYAKYDGYTIWLRAPRPGGDHYVGLEPEIAEAFMQFFAEIRDLVKRHR